MSILLLCGYERFLAKEGVLQKHILAEVGDSSKIREESKRGSEK